MQSPPPQSPPPLPHQPQPAQPQGPQNSAVLVAAMAVAVMVLVGALVFFGGRLLTGDDDEDATATSGQDGSDGTTADDADDGANEDGTGDEDAAGDNDQNGEDQNGNDGEPASDGSGSLEDSSDGNGGGSDEQTTTTESDDGAPATESPDQDFDTDFCEAGTRNNRDIRFAAGASSATTDATLPAGQTDLYRLEVDADQIISARVSPTTAALRVSVMAPDGSTSPGRQAETVVAPTQAGTYLICLTPDGQSVDYELTVSVIDDNSPTKISADWCGTSVNDRGEIRFAPGSSSGTVEQAVIRGERDLYRLDAAAGQQVDITLPSLEDNATFTFRGPDGQTLVTDATELQLPLPQDGTYEICVGSTRGNAGYTLTVGIE